MELTQIQSNEVQEAKPVSQYTLERQKLENHLRAISQQIVEMREQSKLELEYLPTAPEGNHGVIDFHVSPHKQTEVKSSQFNSAIQRRRKKRHREISMSDILPRFDNTQNLLESTADAIKLNHYQVATTGFEQTIKGNA